MSRKPALFSEPWSKITVVLFDRHVEYLDAIRREIRLRHGKAIPRSDLIAAIVEAFSRTSTEEVGELIATGIGYNPRRRLT